MHEGGTWEQVRGWGRGRRKGKVMAYGMRTKEELGGDGRWMARDKGWSVGASRRWWCGRPGLALRSSFSLAQSRAAAGLTDPAPRPL